MSGIYQALLGQNAIIYRLFQSQYFFLNFMNIFEIKYFVSRIPYRLMVNTSDRCIEFNFSWNQLPTKFYVFNTFW